MEHLVSFHDSILLCGVAVDTKVPQALGSFLNCLVNVLGSLILIVGVTPSVVCAIVPLWCIYELVRRRYVATVREVKRLDSLAMSPIFSMFSETLQVRRQNPNCYM